MAYLCTKPKGSCKVCKHYRYDDDYDGMACFAQTDEEDNSEPIKAGSDEYRKTLKEAIAVFGTDAQEKMVLEEMSELQKEICKKWRGKENFRDIAEEIADVEIMLDQLKIMYSSEELVEFYKGEKIARLKERIASCI